MLTRSLTSAAAWATILALTAPLAPAAQAAAPASPAHGPAAAFPRTAPASLLRELRQAWQTTKGNGVTVAVIGGTVDRSAAGLARKVVAGPAYGHPTSGQVTEGTLFASLVAGNGRSTQNPFGTLGIAPRARILSLAVRSTVKTPVWLADLSKAIGYAVRHGAGVIYVEQTSYSDSPALAAAVAAAEAKNVVVVSAEYGPAKISTDPEYPASLPGVLAAASVILPRWPVPPSQLPTPANGSILVAAPGNVLHASGPAGADYPVYNFFAADAWLTATAALIKSAHPGLSPALVARALAASASYRPAGGYRAATGFGLINPAGALTEAGKLTGLRTVAPLGRNAVAPSARLASGAAPGAVRAVHHSAWKLAGYAAIMLAGLIVLLRARRLGRRWRRRARLPTTQSHRISRAAPQPEPEPAPAVTETSGPAS